MKLPALNCGLSELLDECVLPVLYLLSCIMILDTDEFPSRAWADETVHSQLVKSTGNLCFYPDLPRFSERITLFLPFDSRFLIFIF